MMHYNWSLSLITPQTTSNLLVVQCDRAWLHSNNVAVRDTLDLDLLRLVQENRDVRVTRLILHDAPSPDVVGVSLQESIAQKLWVKRLSNSLAILSPHARDRYEILRLIRTSIDLPMLNDGMWSKSGASDPWGDQDEHLTRVDTILRTGIGATPLGSYDLMLLGPAGDENPLLYFDTLNEERSGSG